MRGGDDALRDKVFEVRDRKLRIGLSGAWRFWDADKMRIEVQARDLTRVTISGAGEFRAPDAVRVGQLAVLISGSGSARFDQLNAETLTFQIAGAGDHIELTHTAQEVARDDGEALRLEEGAGAVFGQHACLAAIHAVMHPGIRWRIPQSGFIANARQARLPAAWARQP